MITVKNDYKPIIFISQKHHILNQRLNYTDYTEEQQKFLTMFNFQLSQITQNNFDKVGKLLLK